MKAIEFTRITNDYNGNPRYVVHFLEFISEANEIDVKAQRKPITDGLSALYQVALKKAKTIGGKKYHTKSYGGGIVFQSYNIKELEKDILNLRNQ